jgi:hypothetical protein
VHKYININKLFEKRINKFVNFNILNLQWNPLQYYCHYINMIVFQNFMKLQIMFLKTCWYGIRCRFVFEKLLINLHINEENYIFALWSTIWKPILFLKCKVNDIQTNVFNIHARPMWEMNVNVQYILDPYFAIIYCTSYLIKVNKYVTQEMTSMLNKCKHEQYEASERTKKLENTFLKCIANVYSTNSLYIIINSILSFNKIISIHKYM